MQELESEWTQKRLHKSTVDAFISSESLLAEKNLFTGKCLYSQYIPGKLYIHVCTRHLYQ